MNNWQPLWSTNLLFNIPLFDYYPYFLSVSFYLSHFFLVTELNSPFLNSSFNPLAPLVLNPWRMFFPLPLGLSGALIGFSCGTRHLTRRFASYSAHYWVDGDAIEMDWERKWIGDASRGSEVRGSWVGEW